MKRFLLITVITILITSIIPVNINYAQQHKKLHKYLNKKTEFIENLNLTKEQKNQIDKFRLEHRKAVIDLKAEISKNRLQIEELLKEQNIDESKIRSLVNKNSDLQAKLKESALNMWFKSYSVLDDKQKEQWKENTPMPGGGGRKIKHSMFPGGRGPGLGINHILGMELEHSFTGDEVVIDEIIHEY